MHGSSLWSYAPYRPLICGTESLYICRIAPEERSVHFEWMPFGTGPYSVFCRKRGEESFSLFGKTEKTEFNLQDLDKETDYEFFVQTDTETSAIRLARTGIPVGTVVQYLHPEDRAYAFSGRYLCSPSLVRHPDGFLLASMDLYAHAHPQNLTLIFRSDDDGKTWRYVSELMPCFWGKMFLCKGELYMLACSTEYGDLLIGKSSDGGKTFSAPVCLLRGSNGKNGGEGVHKNPQNVLIRKGRIYNTLEWGAWANKEYGHAAMVMSCDLEDDLMVPENWSFTPPKKFDPAQGEELSALSPCTMTIEGTLVEDPQGNLLNVMRFGGEKCALAYRVDDQDPEAPLTYSHCIPFPANRSKFTIKYDPVSKHYYTVACRLSEDPPTVRNLLSLLKSEDLLHWTVAADLIDRSEDDPTQVGFQYVDFEMEGEDLLFLCRTAVNGAHSFHDSNYITFHRVPDFRKL